MAVDGGGTGRIGRDRGGVAGPMHLLRIPLASLVLIVLFAAAAIPAPEPSAAIPGAGVALGAERPDFVQTSAAGDRLRPMPPVHLVRGTAPRGVIVRVDPAAMRQTIEGIGGSLTEASAAVLAQLPRATRDSVLDRFFGPGGADFTMTRVPIGACDFSVTGNYSYDDTPGDTALAQFSIAHDRAGFAGARDPGYALLPLIHDALARQPALKIVASPWTAPAWMKTSGVFYKPGTGGGSLLPAHFPTFARYIRRYVDAYAAEGVHVWAVTPVNEPLGVGGQWESMEMSPEALRDYIGRDLGPALAGTGVRILQYDQNPGADALRYSRAVFKDPLAARYVWGTALHWYGTTNSARGDVLDAIRGLARDKAIVHTEGCVDALGAKTNSPEGRFLGWKNDAWWWREEATDWGWDWAPAADKPQHPRYAPVHRYARHLIDGLDHGLSGWIDWNIVLDAQGGPNHVNNRCAAPVMVDPVAGDVYATPVYFTIAHFSRYIRPGDRVVRTRVSAPGLGADDFHAAAIMSGDRSHLVVFAFNKSAAPVTYAIQVAGRHAMVTIPANALQTLRFDMREAER